MAAAKKSGPKKQRFSAEKKYQIFLETSREDTNTGEILRREGIYASDLSRYRKLIKEGAIERLKTAYQGRRGPSEEECQIADLNAKLRERDDTLAQMSIERVILEKKVNGV